MKRGEVYDVKLDPVQGSEQGGLRPVVIVSRDAMNATSPVILAAPLTTFRPGRRIYPSQVLVHAPYGGLDVDSVVLGEQVRVIDKGRIRRLRGAFPKLVMDEIDRALLIALDLPGQPKL